MTEEDKSKTIVVVEDEEDISKLISITLNKFYNVKQFFNGDDFISFFDDVNGKSKSSSKETISLIIFDIMLPDYSGIELCKIVRKNPNYKNIPIVMLTAKQSEKDRLLGFDAGTDDYIIKPFFPNELLARVRALFRRASVSEGSDKSTPNNQDNTNMINIEDEIFIDREKFIVYDKNKNEFQLTFTEFKILELLASKRGYPYTRDKIIDIVFGSDYYVIDRTIDVHITHIKNKIVFLKDFIKNVRGVGYKFKNKE